MRPIDWGSIYLNNSAKLAGMCRRYVKNTELAEDLMQDAFITAISKADTFTGKGAIESWLKKITINTVLQYLRGNKNPVFVSEDFPVLASDDALEAEFTLNEQKKIILEAEFGQSELLEIIDQLPDHHKIVFNLYVIENYSHKEIGKLLKISAGTSKSHLARARKKIQQLLYEKAKQMEQDKEKKKSRKVALLLLIPIKFHFIDRVYKKCFANYKIQPSKMPDKLKEVLEHITYPGKPVIFKFSAIKIIYLTTPVILISLSVFLFIGRYNNEKKKTKLQPEIKYIPGEINKTDSLNNGDTLKVENWQKNKINNACSQQPAESELKNIKNNKKPVIIHKKVIVHDTVYEIKSQKNTK